MKVLLAVPPANQSIFADNTLTAVVPPLGLCQVAGCLAAAGHEVILADASAEKLDEPGFIKRVKVSGAVALLFTATTPQVNMVGKVAERVKQENPDIRIVLGGPHASALPRRTLQEFSGLDAVVIGEGDEAANELLKYFESDKKMKQPPGTCVRQKGQILIGPDRDWIRDLDALPLPMFDGLPLDSYGRFFIRRKLKKLPVHTGRGCPFRCAFCYRGMGDKLRTRSVAFVIEEIKRDIKDFGVQQIIFTDENFGLPQSRAFELCENLIHSSCQISWICETHATSLNAELAKIMKAAGCEQVHIGVESGDPEILKTSGKGATLEKVRGAIDAAKQAGLFIQANFIIGHPGETEQSARATIDFARSLGANRCGFAIMVPFPGTKVYNLAEKGEGGYRLLSENWDFYGKQFGYALELVKLPRHRLVQLQLKGYTATLGRLTELAANGFFPDIRTLMTFGLIFVWSLYESIRYKLFGPRKALNEG